MLVLFEDHHLIAVSKPAGNMTQAPTGLASLEAEVKAHIKDNYAKPAVVFLCIPHQFDRPVSGLIVFCRNTNTASRVAEQFQEHRVTKVYSALVEGAVAEEASEWPPPRTPVGWCSSTRSARCRSSWKRRCQNTLWRIDADRKVRAPGFSFRAGRNSSRNVARFQKCRNSF